MKVIIEFWSLRHWRSGMGDGYIRNNYDTMEWE